jgi:two-component system chemotaxis response regulator CheB
VDREPIRLGRVYVAPPGMQTYVHRNKITVRRGPHENLHRPAIDPLFRTAAHHFGSRVVGIVLSGALDDGSAGLAAVKRAGGITIVQDPDDAIFPEMPLNARSRVRPDYCVPARAIPALLQTIVEHRTNGNMAVEVALETVEEASASDDPLPSEVLGPPAGFTCPDCNGTLYEIEDHGQIRYRCRIGHAYSSETIVKAQGDAVERALWAALRALEERVALLNKLADRARARGHSAVAEMFDARSREADEDVRILHEVVTNGKGLEPVEQESNL